MSCNSFSGQLLKLVSAVLALRDARVQSGICVDVEVRAAWGALRGPRFQVTLRDEDDDILWLSWLIRCVLEQV